MCCEQAYTSDDSKYGTDKQTDRQTDMIESRQLVGLQMSVHGGEWKSGEVRRSAVGLELQTYTPPAAAAAAAAWSCDVNGCTHLGFISHGQLITAVAAAIFGLTPACSSE